jgi:hypothetical protein
MGSSEKVLKEMQKYYVALLKKIPLFVRNDKRGEKTMVGKLLTYQTN